MNILFLDQAAGNMHLPGNLPKAKKYQDFYAPGNAGTSDFGTNLKLDP